MLRSVIYILIFTGFSSCNSHVEVSKTIDVTKDFDGLGKTYIWTGSGDCSQKESMPPMFRIHDNVTFKNIVIENAPDGIHIEGSNVRIENMKSLKVCEDAITLKMGNKNIIISGIELRNCVDKGIQITHAENVTVQNSKFFKCSQPVRVKDESKNVIFRNNVIEDCDAGVKIGSAPGFEYSGNSFKNCNYAIRTSPQSSIKDLGNNTYVNVGTLK